MLKNIGLEMQNQLRATADGEDKDNPLDILGSLDEEATKKLEKHMRRMMVGKLSEGMMDSMNVDSGTKRRFKCILRAGEGADDYVDEIEEKMTDILGYKPTLGEIFEIAYGENIRQREVLAEELQNIVNKELDANKMQIIEAFAVAAKKRIEMHSDFRWWKRLYWHVVLRISCCLALILSVLMFSLGLVCTVLMAVLNILTCLQVKVLLMIFMASILTTTIGSYLFFMSLIGIVDPCFGIGGFVVRIAQMLFVDIIGPWSFMLNFFANNAPGFELHNFLKTVFNFLIGRIVIDGVLKSLDLLDILAPVEMPGLNSMSRAIVEMQMEPAIRIQSFDDSASLPVVDENNSLRY